MGGGPPSFPRDSPCPAVLGIAPTRRVACAYGALTRSGRPSQAVRLRDTAGPGSGRSPRRVPQPRRRNGCRLATASVWATARFAHHYSGPRCCFLFLGVLRCFSSPGSPRGAMDSRRDSLASPRLGCPIRTPADHSLSTAPRGFSQSPASFVGPRRPGLPRAPHSARRPPAGAPSLHSTFLSLALLTTLRFLKTGSCEPMVESHLARQLPTKSPPTVAGQKNRPDTHQATLHHCLLDISAIRGSRPSSSLL